MHIQIRYSRYPSLLQDEGGFDALVDGISNWESLPTQVRRGKGNSFVSAASHNC